MLDLKVYEPFRVIRENEEPKVILNTTHNFPTEHGDYYHDRIFAYEGTYQFRYVVHRQNRGFFTPMCFDVHFKWVEIEGQDDRHTLNTLNDLAEPFIEGALFMNHVSPFIVDMLKGQEAGFNRKEVLEAIRDKVEGTDEIWYSDWITPPPTKQNQRIVVYDVDTSCSMLSPSCVVTHVIHEVEKVLNRKPGTGYNSIYYAAIVGGYTEAHK